MLLNLLPPGPAPAHWSWATPAILAALTLSPGTSRAGAWTQPSGGLYLKGAVASVESRVRYDESGSKTGLESAGQPASGTEYRLRELRLYGEYGATARLTVYGSVAYKQALLLEPSTIAFSTVLPEMVQETSGFGDLQAGSRIRLLGGRVPVALAAELKLPTGYSANANPALGNGERDATLRWLAGTSWGSWYATADAAWTHRGGLFRDEIAGSFEAGGRFLDYYRLHGLLRAARPVGGQDAALEDPLFDPASTNPRSITLDVVAGAEVAAGATLQFGVSQLLSGRNTLAGRTFEAGLAWSIETR